MRQARILELYTHTVTPTFSKLGLLGLLSLAFSSKKVLPVSVETTRRGGYKVALLVPDGEDAENDLSDAMRYSVERINSGWEKLRLPKPDNLRTSPIDSTLEHINNAQQLLEYLKKEESHDKRTRAGKSPGLLLAPELGKYSSSQIPYEQAYPNLYDSKGVSACSLTAFLGWIVSTFKTRTDRGLVVVFPSPRSERLGYTETKILYWLSRRLAMFADMLGFNIVAPLGKGGFGLSLPGILAYISPVVRDTTESGDVLSLLDIVTYTLEFDGKVWVSRGLSSIPMHVFTRMPAELASVLLARLTGSRYLASEAPEFFNTLGEYMLSGDTSLYTEALRILASIVASEGKYQGGTVSVAREILATLDRLGV